MRLSLGCASLFAGFLMLFVGDTLFAAVGPAPKKKAETNSEVSRDVGKLKEDVCRFQGQVDQLARQTEDLSKKVDATSSDLLADMHRLHNYVLMMMFGLVGSVVLSLSSLAKANKTVASIDGAHAAIGRPALAGKDDVGVRTPKLISIGTSILPILGFVLIMIPLTRQDREILAPVFAIIAIFLLLRLAASLSFVTSEVLNRIQTYIGALLSPRDTAQ